MQEEILDPKVFQESLEMLELKVVKVTKDPPSFAIGISGTQLGLPN